MNERKSIVHTDPAILIVSSLKNETITVILSFIYSFDDNDSNEENSAIANDDNNYDHFEVFILENSCSVDTYCVSNLNNWKTKKADSQQQNTK